MNSATPPNLLEDLKADQSKSGIFLNEVAQKSPLGVIKLLQYLHDANIQNIGLAFSHRNLSNAIFQKFLYEGWVLRMRSREDELLAIKGLSTEGLKKPILQACIFLNTPPKVIQSPEEIEVKPNGNTSKIPDFSGKLQQVVDAFRFTDMEKFVAKLCNQRHKQGEFYNINHGISPS